MKNVASAIRLNIVSESEFTVKGHGVHTAFLEHVAAMRSLRPDWEILVNSPQRCDVVHAHTVGPYSTRKLRQVTKAQRVITAHIVPDSLSGSLVGGKALHSVSRGYLRWFYNQAELVIAVSREVADTLVQLGVKAKIVVIPNGVDTTQIMPSLSQRQTMRQQLSLSSNDELVVSVGQIQPRKRFDSFCKVASELPDVQFVWVGGMPFKRLASQRKHMLHLIEAAPSNVRVTGVVSRDEAISYLQAADVFFMPSDQENHPLAVLEAAALHKPIVLRDIPEYVSTFGSDVILGDDKSFAQFIERLCTDKAYSKESIKMSQSLARRFDQGLLIKRLAKEYQLLLEAAK